MSSNRKKRKQSHEGRAAAAARLALEKLFTLDDLREVSGASYSGLRRWAVEGRSGVYLDAINHPEKGLCSSVEAVRRFLSQLAAVRAARGGA